MESVALHYMKTWSKSNKKVEEHNNNCCALISLSLQPDWKVVIALQVAPAMTYAERIFASLPDINHHPLSSIIIITIIIATSKD